MRLITFQNRDCMKVLDNERWYSHVSHRLKLVDYDYADEDKGIYPIYTYASLGNRWNPCFGLVQFYTLLTHLAGYMCFDLNNTVMVELEVPEDFILSMKQECKWFEQTCEDDDPDREIRRRNRHRGNYYWVKRDMTQGEIYTSNYLEVVRQNREHSYEAMIPYLDKAHVAAIREFKQENGGYGTTKVTTVYTNEALCPLWYGTVYLTGEGYPKFDDKEDIDIITQIGILKADKRIVFEERVAMFKYGAKSVPGYFTIEEALACAGKTLNTKIRGAVHKLGIEKDRYDDVILDNRPGYIYK